MAPARPPGNPWIRIARLEERLKAETRRADSETRQKNDAIAEKNETVALLNATILEKVIAVERERVAVEQKNEAIEQKNEAIEQKNEAIEQKNEAIARERVAIDKKDQAVDDARYLAYYGIRQNEKLEIMHERLHQSHGRSIENPVARSKRPVVALLDASGSDLVRETHKLPLETYPKVFKIVEGQENQHVATELKRLRKARCEVLVGPEYFANGITLRDSIRKRLPEWTASQLGEVYSIQGVSSDKYVRYGVFAFRVDHRGIRNRSVATFFSNCIADILETPSEDLLPLELPEFDSHASRYITAQPTLQTPP